MEFEPVEAGTQYYDPVLQQTQTYNYSAYYFINFVKSNEPVNIKEFKM